MENFELIKCELKFLVSPCATSFSGQPRLACWFSALPEVSDKAKSHNLHFVVGVVQLLTVDFVTAPLRRARHSVFPMLPETI